MFHFFSGHFYSAQIVSVVMFAGQAIDKQHTIYIRYYTRFRYSGSTGTKTRTLLSFSCFVLSDTFRSVGLLQTIPFTHQLIDNRNEVASA